MRRGNGPVRDAQLIEDLGIIRRMRGLPRLSVLRRFAFGIYLQNNVAVVRRKHGMHQVLRPLGEVNSEAYRLFHEPDLIWQKMLEVVSVEHEIGRAHV